MEYMSRESLLERFLRYISIPSQSDPTVSEVPSTKMQWDMVRELETELKELGLEDIHVSDHAVLTARLAATADAPEGTPVIGFCTHVDTVDVQLDPKISPQVVENYDGGVITLNKEKNLVLDPETETALKNYVGDTIVTTTGNSVLGSDDKAGVAAVMGAITELVKSGAPHGEIYLAFVPDEETGLRGSKKMELDRFPVDFAYTLDCCEIGEVVYETFNAGSAVINIQGVAAHPMSAKGNMVNPVLIACDFVQYFDRLKTPENTDGTDGYIWVQGISGNQSNASVELNIRDHHRDRYLGYKDYIEKAVAFLKERYPRATIELSMEDVYANIKDAKTPSNEFAVDHIYTAMERLGITPKTLSMRGGTDGSYLSSQGIFTPNFFTGGHNFHSVYEYLPLNSLVKSSEMVRTIIDLVQEDAKK